MQSVWDICIIGGGIAGLHVGIESLKRGMGKLVCILEKYDYIGGRVLTFKKNIDGIGPVKWEQGAGRISRSHKKVLGLLKEYGLHFIDISDKTGFISYNVDEKDSVLENHFSVILDTYLAKIKMLPDNILQKYTFGEILENILGVTRAKNFYLEFPYYSEIHTLRADIAIYSFTNEMHDNSGFGVCAEGLSALVDAMKKKFLSLGGKIMYNNDVIDIRLKDDIHLIKTPSKTYKSNICIGALHRNAVAGICGLNISHLDRIKMEPLLRIYAVFDTKDGESWFTGIPKVITDSPVRYIIPINPAKGIIMISYTDGGDALLIHKKKEVQGFIMSEIRKLFPDKDIPDPVFFKKHFWRDGCSYWLPGEYNVREVSRACLHPVPQEMPRFFMCGESFAENQCWIESALDHTDLLLKLPAFRKACRAKKSIGTLKNRIRQGGTKVRGTKVRGTKKKQFLFNPDDPSKSFDVYIDKDPSDTIPIKYTTLKDVSETINKLERLYKTGKYPHKRIWQVGMILKVRLGVLRRKKPEQYKLAKKYFTFLGERTKMEEVERRMSIFHEN